MDENEKYDELKKVTTDVLARHNFYRKKHNVPSLKIDSKLSDVSQDWADQLAKKDIVTHRPNNVYGENIYVIMSLEKVIDLGIKAVDSWYSEIQYFDLQGTNKDMAASIKAFHFTQVIWKNSSQLGVGVANNSKSGVTYLVCNYDPPGNFIPQFKANVLPVAK